MRALAGSLTNAWQRGARWPLLFWPLEVVYRCAVLVRRWCYDRGWLARYRAPVPVIVIGNITAGGSGKTPVVLALVEYLAESGICAGVVSRGHGRSARGVHVVTALSAVEDCGDEPLMIARRTGCPCAVANARPQAVRALLRRYALDVVIADDGLQHYALQRDLEVALYDAQSRFGNGHCLPVGPLREPTARLDEVDLVLKKGGTDTTSVAIVPDGLVNLVTDERRPLAQEAVGRDVHGLAGIAQPEGFFRLLRAAGLQVTEHRFGDHHRYSAHDLAGLDDRPVIMTEKDAVKCRGFAGDNAWYLKIDAVLPQILLNAVESVIEPQGRG